jgi:tRNA(Ile)-lysidine synthase
MDTVAPVPARLAVAVSGGADSLALAQLAAAWAAARSGTLVALTVDHGLRPEAADEAARVAAWMVAAGVEHHVLTWRERPSGNLQAAARRARYALLDGWCADRGIPALLLAHHLEDQAETVLLRLGRGSGVYGLAGMAPVAPPPWPGAPARLRPLLDVPRARLAATLRARGQEWIEDPSNADPAFARVRARAVWPALAGLGITPARLARTAHGLARARAALDGEARALIGRACRVDAGGWCALRPEPFAAAHDEVALRSLALLLMAVGGADYPPRLERLERLRARLAAGPAAATLGGCRLVPDAAGGVLLLREARAVAPPLPLDGGARVWDGRFLVRGPGLTIDRLRRADLTALRAELPESALRRVPAAARPVLAAFRDAAGLAAVPALGWRRAGVQAAAPSAEFLARHRLGEIAVPP